MDSSLRVLVDARPLRQPLSGVGQYVRCLTRALQSEGLVQVGLLEFDFLRRDSRFHEQLGVDRARLLSRTHTLVHRKVFNGLAAYTPLPLGNLFDFGRYDLVYETYFERLPATVLDLRERVPQVHIATVHDVGFLRHPHLFDGRNLAAARRAFDRQVARSRVILTPSEFTRSEVLELTDIAEERIVTPLPSTAPAGHGSEGSQPERTRPFALYVGNIDPRKNLRVLLGGWLGAGLGRDFDLVLAGAPLRGSEAFATDIAGLQDRGVHYLGYIDDAQRQRLYEQAACFVYSSVYEGFGLPVLEAMQAGAPVLVSDAAALAEVVGPAAEIVPHADAEGFGRVLRVLRALLEDPERRAVLRARGRARAAEFDWTTTAQTTLAGYLQAFYA